MHHDYELEKKILTALANEHTAQDLAKKFKCPQRKIWRYVERLRLAGHDVVKRDREVRGHTLHTFQILPPTAIGSHGLNEKEIHLDESLKIHLTSEVT